jgi:high affinity sulfate transporter 1
LRHDATAGLSVAAVALPVGVAYAELTGFEPVVGLYASILPLAGYAFFGTSRQLIVGPDAATCAMTAAAVAPLAGGDPALYLSLTVFLTFAAGLFCIGASFLRLGALADFLSKPILVGYLAGVALSIVLGQIGKVTGLTIEAGGIVPKFIELVREIAMVHPATLAVGAVAFAVLLVGPRLAPRVPAALLALVVSAAIVALLGLDRAGVRVIGEVPPGLPTLRVPDVPIDRVGLLLAQAAALALVSFTSSIVTTRAFAAKNRYEIDVDREFAALGVAQVCAAVSQAFPVAGADSRTATNDAAGGRTQATSLVAAGTLTIVLLFFTGPIRYVPTAALGAVLIKSAISLVDAKGFREVLRVDRREFLLAVLTMLGVVWWGAIDAVLLAVLLALLRFVRIAARPDVEVLGVAPDARGFHDLRHDPQAAPLPGLVVLRFGGPLVFFNAPYLKDRVLAAADEAGSGLRAVILDATGLSTREDATGVFMLLDVRRELASRGVEFALAGKRHLIEAWLAKRGLDGPRPDGTPRIRLFSTLEDAVDALSSGPLPR